MTLKASLEHAACHTLALREHALLSAALRRAAGELTADELDDFVVEYADAHRKLRGLS